YELSIRWLWRRSRRLRFAIVEGILIGAEKKGGARKVARRASKADQPAPLGLSAEVKMRYVLDLQTLERLMKNIAGLASLLIALLAGTSNPSGAATVRSAEEIWKSLENLPAAER